jgi:hypothetical protein
MKNRCQDKLTLIKEKKQILNSLRGALGEVNDVKLGKRKEGKSLEEFLNEN